MFRKLLLFGFCLFLAACGFTKKIPEGSPSPIKAKALLDSIQNQRLEFNSLILTGTGNYKDAKQDQSFRFRIRMLKDSVIWVDITDPIIGGIKVARAVLYPDSVAFVNFPKQKILNG